MSRISLLFNPGYVRYNLGYTRLVFEAVVGFRFRRSFKLIPGVRLNLSGSGASVSVGARGFHYTVGARGTRTTVSIPGTGVSWSEYRSYSTKPRPAPIQETPSYVQPPSDVGARIESAPIEAIAAHSTSELIPYLNELHKRWRLSHATIAMIILTVSLGVLSNNPAFITIALGFALLVWPLTLIVDRQRKSLKLEYELDSDARSRVNLLNDSFQLLLARDVGG